jgi:hypothetical protein
MWPFTRKFRGLIKPNMGLGFSDSRHIADRKSLEMVVYLRTRRDLKMADSFAAQTVYAKRKAHCRREHLRAARAKRLVRTMRPLGL